MDKALWEMNDTTPEIVDTSTPPSGISELQSAFAGGGLADIAPF